MKLVAFVHRLDPYTPGVLADEIVKGPLLRTIDSIECTGLLLISSDTNDQRLKLLERALPPTIPLTIIKIPFPANDSLDGIVAALIAQQETLKDFRDSLILESGNPLEQAALCILRHEGILCGTMASAPGGLSFAMDGTRPSLSVAEPIQPFEEAVELYDQAPWTSTAQRIGCVGRSPRFRRTLDEAAALSEHPTPILLIGETGCGKDVLARFIHALSPRHSKPLVAVNCAALPETLAESLLFGHEKGSFTGAYKRQKGKFELADGGTLFLDELGDLSLANQAKLLRVLETHTIDLLGGSQPVQVDVRIIAATNRKLQQEVALGRFREDLYYRLRGGEIEIPSLRERNGDIPLISMHLLERFNTSLANPKQLSKAALKFLEAQRWPGNVRDLMNTIERAALTSSHRILQPEDFRINSEIKLISSQPALPNLYPGFSMENHLYKIRRDLFEKALQQSNGNRSEAARLLGVTPQAVHKYLKANEDPKKGSTDSDDEPRSHALADA